jgi:hypothetical protein
MAELHTKDSHAQGGARARRDPDAPGPRRRLMQAVLAVVGRAAMVAVLVVGLLLTYGLVDNRWYRVLSVHGDSMNPTIEAGDAIVITRPPPRIAPGMILTVQVDGQVVTHRVVDVGPHGDLTLQGDANPSVDDWSGNEVHIVGIQRLRVPKLGAVLDRFSRVLASSVATGAWWSTRLETGPTVVDAAPASNGSTSLEAEGSELETDDRGAESASPGAEVDQDEAEKPSLLEQTPSLIPEDLDADVDQVEEAWAGS